MAGSGLVRTETKGDVRLVWLLAPPGNLFGPALCAALMDTLKAALNDAQIRAVVIASGLRAKGQGFSGGVDLADLGQVWPQGVATPADIARLIYAAPVPVIAALHGPVLGAGAELALAARGRVATPDMRLGLRDVLVGRLPMAGGTQTLTRLIGAAEALRLIGQAGSIGAGDAMAMGAVDQVVEGDELISAAVAMALAAPGADRSPGLRDAKGFQAAVVAGRQAADGDAVKLALLDCVEAAQLLPLEQGLAFEAELAAEIAARPEAAALQHLMTSEMRMVVDLVGGQPARRLGLWGAGTGPLILPALRAGLDVVLADNDRPALLQAIEKVALAQEEQVQAGRLTY
ncbi:MAG: enoyl-CoA hydratase/isomerase family protein [Paracoccaceae bacterium]